MILKLNIGLCFALVFSFILALPSLTVPAEDRKHKDENLDIEKVYREIIVGGTAFVAVHAAVFGTKKARNPIKFLEKYDRVHRLDTDGIWVRIRTTDNITGWIYEKDLSSLWIHVSKHNRVVTLLDGLDQIVSFKADFSLFISGDKIKRGTSETPEDWRTPEGLFYVAEMRANSNYHKALLINYPSVKHATRAIQSGLINDTQFSRILKSYRKIDVPPMDTALGGLIEIHGDGTNGQLNWTKGCVAIENHEIDFIFDRVSVGTPVWIEARKKIILKSIKD